VQETVAFVQRARAKGRGHDKSALTVLGGLSRPETPISVEVSA
jgi:hypothetical protein